MDDMNSSKNEKLKLDIQQKEAVDEESDSKTDKVLRTAQGYQSAVYPTLHVKIGNEEVRVMIDAGETSSYICSDIVTKLKLTPVRKEKRCIQQMYGTVNKVVEVYEITMQSLAVPGYNIKIECINAQKGILTCLPNPRIVELKKRNPSLRELNLLEEETTGESMPVHLILGVSDYQRIRTSENILILGADSDTYPGAEFTMLGWGMFGGKQNRVQPTKNFLLHTGQDELEKLCNRDVLGVTDPIDKFLFTRISSNNSKRMMQVFFKQDYLGNPIIWHYLTNSNCHNHDCTAPLENWKKMGGLKNTMGSCGNS